MRWPDGLDLGNGLDDIFNVAFVQQICLFFFKSTWENQIMFLIFSTPSNMLIESELVQKVTEPVYFFLICLQYICCPPQTNVSDDQENEKTSQYVINASEFKFIPN